MGQPEFLLVVAGPNGAGKSTFTRASNNVLPVIDPDQIARAMNPARPEGAALAAGKEALRRAQDFLKTRQSFAQETTLAGKSALKLMKQAKKAGFRVQLVYVGLDSPEKSRLRIAERVTKGGHNIPLADLKRRYVRSMQNLKKALAVADGAKVYDNSDHKQAPRKIMETEKGRVVFRAEKMPPWASKALGKTKDFGRGQGLAR